MTTEPLCYFFLCEQQIFDAGISMILFESLLMVAAFVCECKKQIQYQKKKKSHLKVPPFMCCQTQRHLPQIRHERPELGELLLCAPWASSASMCIKSSEDHLLSSERCEPPDFSPPHPRPPPLRQPRCQSPH